MMAKLLSRSIQVICVGGLAFGMTTAMAMAQDTSAVLQHVQALDSEHLIVVAYSDPETEVGNGTNPPDPYRWNGESSDDVDSPTEKDNFPETEASVT